MISTVTASRPFRAAFGLLCSSLIFVVTGEALLRVVYRDQGTKTLGGPGGRSFEHEFREGELRGRLDSGPRKAGVPRLVAIGDSITWGQGVRDWKSIWTEQLAQALEGENGPIEMAVLAAPGRNIPEHLVALERWGQQVQPDVLVYQWYVNDLEVSLEGRPPNRRGWRRWPLHPQLLNGSYLYYFFERMADQYLPAPDRSYVDYILQDYQPGSLAWTEFERFFHNFATRAKEIAPRRLIVLYPQVPFAPPYPLKLIHDRMHALAGPHVLAIPPGTWIRIAGTIEARPDAPWKQALRVPAGTTGTISETRDYYVGDGKLDLVIRGLSDSSVETPTIGVEIIDSVTNQVVAQGSALLDGRLKAWQEARVSIDVRGTAGHSVRFRLLAQGAPLLLSSIELPVDYGFTVVDLTDRLNGFNTHASMFDAHPNERAHQVIAEEVHSALARERGNRPESN